MVLEQWILALPDHDYDTRHRQQRVRQAMEELTPEARQILDLLKVSAKETVDERVNAYRSSATKAMADQIKDNDTKFGALQSKVDDAVTEIRRALDKFGGGASASASPTAAIAAANRSALDDPDGPMGHRGEQHGRRTGLYVPPPARGTRENSHNSALDKPGDELFMEFIDHFVPGPRVELPRFDGMNPRLWQTRCEEYFTLWGRPVSLWIPYSSAQFEGAAAKWLESFRHLSPKAGWEEFCLSLQARFGRNQHASLLRKMFHICQTSTGGIYVEEFSQLMDQLSAYGHHPDPLYYVTRFIDGLKPAVRLMVAIPLPGDLDAAYQLALLHEELGDGSTPIQYCSDGSKAICAEHATCKCHTESQL